MAPNPIYKEIGALIRHWRKQRNLKQFKLAAMLGISRGSLANVETGRQSILVHQLYKFAEVLELSPIDLLPSASAPAPLQQDWSSKMPPGLKRRQEEQIARLLEERGPEGARLKRGGNGKPTKQ